MGGLSGRPSRSVMSCIADRGTLWPTNPFLPQGEVPQEVIVMLFKSAASLAFATACLMAAAIPANAQMANPYSGGTQLVTNGPQASPGDTSSNWSARQNVAESHRYDKLLESNRSFRDARRRKECGPISDPQLRQSCLASFGQDEPYAGSSSPRHRSYHTGSGQ